VAVFVVVRRLAAPHPDSEDHVKIQRTVETTAAPAAVFAYLSDFTTTTEWDPGTVRTTRTSGDGGVGTTYTNVSKFGGRETELTYTVVEHEPDRRFALRGENKTVTAHDTMEIAPNGTGSRVTYTADFDFHGVVKYVAPLLAPAFKKLGDEAEEGLRSALAGL
jgi:carbon monoxide dehydrogenase subunit G